jgi:hypothetical protein
MSTFDPQSFLSADTAEQMDTRFPLIPQGEYPAIVKGIDARQQESSKNPGTVWTILDITYTVDDAGVREETGLPEPTIRQSIFLDVKDDGTLDTGPSKNVNLGRLRAALGLNQAGQSFNFNMLVGQPSVVAVKHNPDRNDPEIVYANVSRVAAMA